MYGNVALHAWSPPNFPHSEKQAKVTRASSAASNFGVRQRELFTAALKHRLD